MPQHAVCRPWLTRVISNDSQFAVSPVALSAVVRITTNARIFRTPSTLSEAFGFCDDILGQPHCEIVEPGERHWDILRRICIDTDTRGPRVSDAWFAALAIEAGCTWITADRDFARFPELDWRVPEAE
jgi:toxin-antitoxin system PIN domain toxin